MPGGPRRVWVFALLAVALLYPSPHHEQLNNPNENVRFYMTAAIAELGTYQIDELRQRWGWVNDAAVYEGRIYSVKAPGTSLLGVPIYAALHHLGPRLGWQVDRHTALWICRIFASVLPTLLFLWLFYPWWGRHVRSPVVRDATFFAMALGSLLYGYALLYVSHTTAAASALAAFALLEGARDPKRAGRWHVPFLAGLCAAGVTFFEYPGVVVSAVLFAWGLWVLRRPRPIAWLCLGALIPTLLVMHFQWCAFDNPFMPGHLHVENKAFRALHERGLFGAEAFHLDAAWRLLLDPAFGLLPLTPILIFGVPGLLVGAARRQLRSPALVGLLIVGLSWVAASSLSNWRGGWTIGPRYLAWTVPFWAWGAALALDKLTGRWPRVGAAIALGGLATSLLASGLPSAWYPHLPEALSRPLPQLFLPALSGGFVPRTAAALLGMQGWVAALPLLGVGVLVLATTATADWGGTDRLGLGALGGRLAAGAAVAALAAVPVLYQPDLSGREWKEADGATAFVLEHWSPPGQDLASALRADLEAGRSPAENWATLARTYADQRRWAQARRALAHVPPAQAAEISEHWRQ